MTDTESVLTADEMMVNIRDVRPDLADALERAMSADTREEFAAAVDAIAVLPPDDDAPIGDAWLTVPEVAAELGVNHETTRKYIRCRELPATKIGGAWRIRQGDVLAFIAARGTDADEA